jgi:DNA invertase Pin-like site-specific DNA recombinase
MTSTKQALSNRRVGLYLRVSTSEQTTANQRRELMAVAERHDWAVVRIFEDAGISGAKSRGDRPGLDALMKAVARREIDMVAAWSVDRLGRSLTDLLDLLRELHSKGIDLFLHQQGLDTSTPGGRAMFQMIGVFAEFERAMLRERVISGLARAREQCTKLGRPRLAAEKEQAIRQARAGGKGIRRIARDLGVGVGTVLRVTGIAEAVSR